MSEIYWLVVIGNLHNVIMAIFVALVFVLIVSFLLYMFGVTYIEEKEEFSRFAKKVSLAIICTSIILCFLPSKNDLLAVYGIGGTIDYIKSNDKAKELPDKVVDALTEYLDNIKDQDNESK